MQGRPLSVALALAALSHAGCEIVTDFDRDRLKPQPTDPAPLPVGEDGAVSQPDGGDYPDGALVQPEPPDAASPDGDAGPIERDAAEPPDGGLAEDAAEPGADAAAPDADADDADVDEADAGLDASPSDAQLPDADGPDGDLEAGPADAALDGASPQDAGADAGDAADV